MIRCLPFSAALREPIISTSSSESYSSDVEHAVSSESDSEGGGPDPQSRSFIAQQPLSVHLEAILAKETFSETEKQDARDILTAHVVKERQARLARISTGGGTATKLCAQSASLIGEGVSAVGALIGALSAASGSMLMGATSFGTTLMEGGLGLGALVLGRGPDLGRGPSVDGQRQGDAPAAARREDCLVIAVNVDGVLVADS